MFNDKATSERNPCAGCAGIMEVPLPSANRGLSWEAKLMVDFLMNQSSVGEVRTRIHSFLDLLSAQVRQGDGKIVRRDAPKDVIVAEAFQSAANYLFTALWERERDRQKCPLLPPDLEFPAKYLPEVWSRLNALIADGGRQMVPVLTGILEAVESKGGDCSGIKGWASPLNDIKSSYLPRLVDETWSSIPATDRFEPKFQHQMISEGLDRLALAERFIRILAVNNPRISTEIGQIRERLLECREKLNIA